MIPLVIVVKPHSSRKGCEYVCCVCDEYRCHNGQQMAGHLGWQLLDRREAPRHHGYDYHSRCTSHGAASGYVIRQFAMPATERSCEYIIVGGNSRFGVRGVSSGT